MDTFMQDEQNVRSKTPEGLAGSLSFSHRRSARKNTSVASAMWYNKTSAITSIRTLNTEASTGMRPLARKKGRYLNMDALSAIFSRRSIRLYTAKSVSREMVNEILRAAMSAPSAGNERPWHFIVLTDRAVLDAIPKFHPYSAMLKHAQAAILVCGDVTLEKHKGYWTLDCAAATENMLLAAHAKGLGAVWCGVYPTEDRVANLKRLLNLPEHIVPFSLVPLGFPAEEKQAPDRFEGSRVHENRWP